MNRSILIFGLAIIGVPSPSAAADRSPEQSSVKQLISRAGRRLLRVARSAFPENSKGTITPMLHLLPEDPLWGRRALRIAELMEKLWTGTNAVTLKTAAQEASRQQLRVTGPRAKVELRLPARELCRLQLTREGR